MTATFPACFMYVKNMYTHVLSLLLASLCSKCAFTSSVHLSIGCIYEWFGPVRWTERRADLLLILPLSPPHTSNITATTIISSLIPLFASLPCLHHLLPLICHSIPYHYFLRRSSVLIKENLYFSFSPILSERKCFSRH